MRSSRSSLGTLAAAAVTAGMAIGGSALADGHTTLRIQTHFSAESTPGKVVAQFIDDVETMAAGRLKIQIHCTGRARSSTRPRPSAPRSRGSWTAT